MESAAGYCDRNALKWLRIVGFAPLNSHPAIVLQEDAGQLSDPNESRFNANRQKLRYSNPLQIDQILAFSSPDPTKPCLSQLAANSFELMPIKGH